MSAKPDTGSDGAIPPAAYVASFPPEIAQLIHEVRSVAADVAPAIEEKAYRGWGLRYVTDRGALAIAGFRDHVNVILFSGATFDDPDGLLKGAAASTRRRVRVRTVAEARSDGLRRLVKMQLRSGPKRMTTTIGAGKRIFERIRRICLGFSEATERRSHGAPTFFFRDKKQFAQVWTAHEEDGRYALWCAAPLGAQAALVKADAERFFVPPYVGHRGWLGVRLDRPIDWTELRGILEDAYEVVASSMGHFQYRTTVLHLGNGMDARGSAPLQRRLLPRASARRDRPCDDAAKSNARTSPRSTARSVCRLRSELPAARHGLRPSRSAREVLQPCGWKGSPEEP